MNVSRFAESLKSLLPIPISFTSVNLHFLIWLFPFFKVTATTCYGQEQIQILCGMKLIQILGPPPKKKNTKLCIQN